MEIRSHKEESRQVQQRLERLEEHLKAENPVLLQVVHSFRQMDQVAYALGLLDHSESFATRVSWWPMISILGTYSSGKSTYINYYLGMDLQKTGTQAVDDKFTVICYGVDETPRTLPGISLDSDPRFPFYRISKEIENVDAGQGYRVDAYLQLKTCPSEKMRGKILIDSPGFDADAQRTSTLQITDRIMDLSDLVLVLFDARHPEAGAMHDTLQHLVSGTIKRADSNKFLYILNQVDVTAREDNPEEVFAAWQRALSQHGLTAGYFYRIYNPNAATPIEDDARRARFESKRDTDLNEIETRIKRVEVERSYRIIGVLEQTAKCVEEGFVNRMIELRRRWRKRVLIADGAIFLTILILAGVLGTYVPWWSMLFQHPVITVLGGVIILGAALYIHFSVRALVARRMEKRIDAKGIPMLTTEMLRRAFRFNTSPWRLLFRVMPVGWNKRAQRRVSSVLADADQYIQSLNDQFTNPSGEGHQPMGNIDAIVDMLPADEEDAERREDDDIPRERGTV
ncbi:MAG: dynamin family protein [Gammaproteobacteria bacterium]|nr:dynamin family protein [Gammaproteobacteria bacterium]